MLCQYFSEKRSAEFYSGTMMDIDSIIFDPNRPAGMMGPKNWQRQQNGRKSSYLRKIGKPCTGLTGSPSSSPAKRRPLQMTRTVCQPSSPLPGDRWYGSPSRMTFEEQPKAGGGRSWSVSSEQRQGAASAESSCAEEVGGESSAQQSEADPTDRSAELEATALPGPASLTDSQEEKSTEYEDEEEEEDDDYEDYDEEEGDTDLAAALGGDHRPLLAAASDASLKKALSSNEGESEEEKPLSPTGLAAGAMLGFGIGMSVALPAWYFLTSGESLCTYSSWTSKY